MEAVASMLCVVCPDRSAPSESEPCVWAGSTSSTRCCWQEGTRHSAQLSVPKGLCPQVQHKTSQLFSNNSHTDGAFNLGATF